MIDQDLIDCSITSVQAHLLEVGDYITVNGKSCKVSSVQDTLTFTVRALNRRERRHLFWLGFLQGLAMPVRLVLRGRNWIVEKWGNQ